MNTLTISQIFSNINFYQTNYLNIIALPQQYYIPVHGAVIDVWPFKSQQLFLGDLLQLWFAEKWKHEVESNFNFFSQQNSDTEFQDAYIYAIHGNLFTGSNSANIYSISEKSLSEVKTNQLRKFIFEFKALTRPKFQDIRCDHEYRVI